MPLIVLYGLLIYAHGYTFGSEDQVDFMPYALHLQDNQLYSGDFYVECMKGQFNERWVIAHALACIPEAAWPGLFLLLHFLSTILLMHGMRKFCVHFGLTPIVQWLVLAAVLILLYHRNLGGNELYYNMLTPSLLAKSLCIWSLWFAFNQNKWIASILVVSATYIHPVAGIQVFILGLILLDKPHRFVFATSTLLCTLPYLILLYANLSGPGLTAENLVNIMRLRNPHHFIPLYFGWSNYILLVPLFLLGTLAAYRVNKKIFYLELIILIGCLLYSVCLLIFPAFSIKTQWFKSTIWLKFYAILMLVKWLSGYKERFNAFHSLILRPGILIIPLFILLVLMMANRQSGSARYVLPWSAVRYEQQIAMKAASMSQPKDLFLVSADYTSFKYDARRPTWVDWKAIPHQKDCLQSWAVRVKLAYGLGTGYHGDLTSIYRQSNQFLEHLNADDKQLLKAKGVAFIIFRPKNGHDFMIEKL